MRRLCDEGVRSYPGRWGSNALLLPDQLHGVNEYCKVVLKKQIKRDQMGAFFANLPPCLVGMEACGGAHHWARKLKVQDTRSG